MSKFIETDDGSFVLSSEIVRVRNRGDLVCTITTKSGELYSVGHNSSYVTHVAEFNNGSVVPAHPGYSVIRATLSEESGEWQYELFPVVGWSKLQIEDHMHYLGPRLSSQVWSKTHTLGTSFCQTAG